ncbi:MAG: hypothetical protein WAK76_15300 [Trebonia sp.]
MSTTSPGRESSWICMVSGSSSWAALPLGAGARAADLTDPALVSRFFGDLGDIDHLVFTAGEPLALMNLAALDLDKAREFFALRYFGALWAVHAAAPHLQPGGSITF